VDPVSPSPRVIGRYALHDAFASGGMATVHLGRLLGPVGFARTVAIKRLHAQFAQDPEFVSMFLDEARVVARIRHPNVVPTLDVVAADGELFIVMEYVQGESLARLIKAAGAQGSRIPMPFVASMLVGVLHGLHAAHEARNERGEPLDVVHRDISPQNILVGIDGVARVLDFGVAKAAGRIQTTREGQLKGKLPYMAPEQISGEVSRASDVYSASVVLWEALTGRRLFAADSDAHVMKLVLENRVTPPSEHVPDLPPALDALTLRGLSREPSDRFSTAKEMALALEDAVPAVAQSKIGTWVEATASKRLVDCSERIAIIESSSPLDAPLVPQATPEPSVSGSAHVQPSPPARSGEDVQTQLSSSAPAQGQGSKVSLAPRMKLMLAASAGVLVVALGLALSMRRTSAPISTAAVEPAAPPAAQVSASTGPASARDTSTQATHEVASTVPSVAPAPSASSASTSGRSPARHLHPPSLKPPPVRYSGVDDGTHDRK
jgi:serine/threonine-protein kinase